MRIENHDSLVLLRPTSEPEREWLDENVDPEATWWGGALVVEPRYVDNILAGMAEGGVE